MLQVATKNVQTMFDNELSYEKKRQLDKTLQLSGAEHFEMQQLQSTEFAGGRIDLETSNFLYASLGGTASVFNRQSLATRYMVLSLIKEITNA
jgi:hypothetical protein